MSRTTFNGHTHVRLGDLEVDTEFMYKGHRYKVNMRSRYYRISNTTGSVYVSRTDYVKPAYQRKRWTLLARTPILRSDIF